MKKLVLILVLAVCTFSFYSCVKKFKCEFDTCHSRAAQYEIDSLKAYLDSAAITATQHCSGLFYVIENPGTGDNATGCSSVTVQYKGRLLDGTLFDETPGTSSTTFSLNNVIEGWKNSIPLLKNGGKMRVYIPASLAYGDREFRDANGFIIIPSKSVLVFDITLLNFTN